MNYREIDLNLLMILDAMYDAGSTTLVAERLKVSQPTVSFSLGKLRDVFGDELSSGMALRCSRRRWRSRSANPCAA